MHARRFQKNDSTAKEFWRRCQRYRELANDEPKIKSFKTDDFRRPPSGVATGAEFEKAIRDALSDGKIVRAQFTSWPGSWHHLGGLTLSPPDDCELELHFSDLTAIQQLGPITVSDCRINHLTIHSGKHNSVKINACEISHLTITNNSDIEIYDSWIGEFRAVSGCISRLDIRNSGVLSFNVPPPSDNPPITGDVNFRDVYLPRRPNVGPLVDPQPYRNMRAHLTKLQNLEVAGAFHSAELSMARRVEIDRGLNWLLNWTYETKAYPSVSGDTTCR